jgi:hypothetical protein
MVQWSLSARLERVGISLTLELARSSRSNPAFRVLRSRSGGADRTDPCPALTLRSKATKTIQSPDERAVSRAWVGRPGSTPFPNPRAGQEPWHSVRPVPSVARRVC